MADEPKTMKEDGRVEFYSDRQKDILHANIKLMLGTVQQQLSKVMTEKYKLEVERDELEDLLSKLYR
jgi:hypothetical protein